MSINIDDLTVRELKEITKLAGARGNAGKSHSLAVGMVVFIRTVTMYYTGKIEAITASDIKLVDAAWIADTGRFNEFLKSGKFNECEPFPSWVVVPRGCIVDVAPWTHPLPSSVK